MSVDESDREVVMTEEENSVESDNSGSEAFEDATTGEDVCKILHLQLASLS